MSETGNPGRTPIDGLGGDLVAALELYRSSRGARALEVLRAAVGRSPALDDRLAAAGVAPADASLDDLESLPVLGKDAVPALQQASPPLGGLLAEGADVVRLFASPGPMYEPQLAGPDPWRWRPALEASGIGAGDIVLNCFGYHLTPAGMMFDEACRAVGATVVPGGVGALDAQARLVADLGVGAYIGLPSYLASLIERYDELGLSGQQWRVTRALMTAEPLPDSLRAQLSRRVESVFMAYGTAEAGLIGYERIPAAGLVPSPDLYVQICDPATGRPVAPGEPGEVVVSVLDPDFPLLRFGTGDVSRWVLGPDRALLLAGVLGRVGAAVKVRGLFVHPHQLAEVAATLVAHGAQAVQFVVERPEHTDILRVDMVAAEAADRDELSELALASAQRVLRVRPVVRLIDALETDALLVDARTWE